MCLTISCWLTVVIEPSNKRALTTASIRPRNIIDAVTVLEDTQHTLTAGANDVNESSTENEEPAQILGTNTQKEKGAQREVRPNPRFMEASHSATTTRKPSMTLSGQKRHRSASATERQSKARRGQKNHGIGGLPAIDENLGLDFEPRTNKRTKFGDKLMKQIQTTIKDTVPPNESGKYNLRKQSKPPTYALKSLPDDSVAEPRRKVPRKNTFTAIRESVERNARENKAPRRRKASARVQESIEGDEGFVTQHDEGDENGRSVLDRQLVLRGDSFVADDVSAAAGSVYDGESVTNEWDREWQYHSRGFERSWRERLELEREFRDRNVARLERDMERHQANLDRLASMRP